MELDLEDLKNKQRDEIRAVLVEQSRRYADSAGDAHGRGRDAAGRRSSTASRWRPRPLREALDDGRLQSLADWLRQRRCTASCRPSRWSA